MKFKTPAFGPRRLTPFAIAFGMGVAAPAWAQSDDFNRADAATLGPNWTQQSGTSAIVGNKAVGSNGAVATYNGSSANRITFDLSKADTSLGYGAATFGDPNNPYFLVKVQGSNTFTNYAIYRGGTTDGVFGTLTNQTAASGQVVAYYDQSTVTLLYTPTGGVAEQHSYTFNFTPTGMTAGLGFFGSAQIDNFVASSTPEPTAWLLMILGFGAVGGSLRRPASGDTPHRSRLVTGRLGGGTR